MEDKVIKMLIEIGLVEEWEVSERAEIIKKEILEKAMLKYITEKRVNYDKLVEYVASEIEEDYIETETVADRDYDFYAEQYADYVDEYCSDDNDDYEYREV